MNEKQLGKALLKLDANELAGGPSVQQLTWKILERDRRRVRLLGIATTVLWLLSVVSVSSFFYLIFFAYRPRLQKLVFDLSDPEMHRGGPKYENWKDWYVGSLDVMDRIGRIAISGSIVIFLLAALTTVLYIFLSRRATLRQVNSSLVSISEQIKQLREELGKGLNH